MVQYKLTYFNARGRGELIRLVFAAAEKEFVDERIEFADWPGRKASSPFGQLPYLEIKDGAKVHYLAQSITIARYLARKFGLAGKDELEQAFADMYVDQISDLQNAMISAHFEKDEARKKETNARIQTETMPHHLKIYEKRLAENNGHLSGSSLSYADLHLFGVLNYLSDFRDAILQAHPNMRAFYYKIESFPSIKNYLDNRPKTEL